MSKRGASIKVMHQTAVPMEMHSGLQPIREPKLAAKTPKLTALDAQAAKESGRICNASMPTWTAKAGPYPPHVTPARIEAFEKPSLWFGNRIYPNGRIEDMAGNVLKEAHK